MLSSCDEGEFFFAHVVRPLRAFRDHEESEIGGAIVNADINIIRHISTEFGQNFPRLPNRAAAMGARLIPIRRQTYQQRG